MKKWFTLVGRATCFLVLFALLALLFTDIGTKRKSRTRLCVNCLAHRRTVVRTRFWRTIEDRDTVYPLAGNENVICQHEWLMVGGSDTFGFGGGSFYSYPSSPEQRIKRAQAIDEYEQRTGRRYDDELERLAKLDR